MAWENFDEALQKRLGYSANGGIRRRSVPKYEMRGAGDGRGLRQTGYSQYDDISYYRNNEDWQKVSNSLGIKKVDSMNDVNQMIDFVNQGRYGGGGSKVEEEQKPTDNPNNSQPEKNEPTVNYNPTSTVVEGQNQETKQPSEDTAASRLDPNNLSRWGNSTDRFGWADFQGAMDSGYTKGDINQWLSSIGNENVNTGGDWYKGFQEANSGQVSKMFGNIGGAGTEQANWFGRADLQANRKMGLSDYQILSYLDNNLSSLQGNNAKGVAGGIYEELNSMRPVDPKNLLTGGSNLGNAGYADAVKPNRSAASSSTRSSNGTSQFNRSNFGNKKKSGISSIGLNI